MKSATLQQLYKSWQSTATLTQLEFVDSVYLMCEEHYGDGGDTIVECFTPSEVLREFTCLSDVESFCGLKVEQALNARWGEDGDPQMERQERFDTSGDWAKE